MADLFFDTSALVKRYHREPGTERVDELLDEPEAEVMISSLSTIETVSAFRRKFERGAVDEAQLNDLIGAFFHDALEEFSVLSMDEGLDRFSFELIADDGLRTLDGLQLSTGLAVAGVVDEVTFVTADEELASIAAKRGLAAENPLEPS